MPENPAKLLYDRLSEWATTPPGYSVLRYRAPDGDWVALHLEALTWLGQVRDHLRAIDWDEKMADSFMTALTSGVFSTGHEMTQNSSNSREHVRKSDLQLLSLLATTWGEVTHEPDSPALVELADTAHEMSSLIADASYLDDEVRHYLLGLCQHLEKACTNIGVFGPGELRSLVNELVGALALYMADAPEEDRAETGKFLRKVCELAGKVFRVAGRAAVEGAVNLALGELPPGN